MWGGERKQGGWGWTKRGGGGTKGRVSNWILTSCQPRLPTSGRAKGRAELALGALKKKKKKKSTRLLKTINNHSVRRVLGPAFPFSGLVAVETRRRARNNSQTAIARAAYIPQYTVRLLHNVGHSITQPIGTGVHRITNLASSHRVQYRQGHMKAIA